MSGAQRVETVDIYLESLFACFYGLFLRIGVFPWWISSLGQEMPSMHLFIFFLFIQLVVHILPTYLDDFSFYLFIYFCVCLLNKVSSCP